MAVSLHAVRVDPARLPRPLVVVVLRSDLLVEVLHPVPGGFVRGRRYGKGGGEGRRRGEG